MKNILDKMASRGVEALSDRELLALLTDDEQLAEVVLSAYDGSLARIGDQPEARLRMVGGLGLKRARMLLAAAEFGRRAVASGAVFECNRLKINRCLLVTYSLIQRCNNSINQVVTSFQSHTEKDRRSVFGRKARQ